MYIFTSFNCSHLRPGPPSYKCSISKRPVILLLIIMGWNIGNGFPLKARNKSQ